MRRMLGERTLTGILLIATLAAGSEQARDTPYRFMHLSPAHRAIPPLWSRQYAIEPYAMAADVCTQPPFAGRGGWSWYTGSAAWMHRAAVESILGRHIQAEELFFTPSLSSQWPQAELVLTREGRSMRFLLIRGTTGAPVARCAEEGAAILQVSSRLRWTGLAAHSCFVIPVDEAAMTGPSKQ